MTPTLDRRLSERLDLARPCKAYCPATRRFAAGQTRNVSESGALVTLTTTRPWLEGERIDVIVAWSHRGLLPADAMRRATVVRAEAPAGERQTIAIRFAELMALRDVA